jgi:hypothetical protein
VEQGIDDLFPTSIPGVGVGGIEVESSKLSGVEKIQHRKELHRSEESS